MATMCSTAISLCMTYLLRSWRGCESVVSYVGILRGCATGKRSAASQSSISYTDNYLTIAGSRDLEIMPKLRKQISAENNDKLVELLRDRDDILRTFYLGNGDDEHEACYKHFREIYDTFEPVDKDVWYICTIYSPSMCASLFQVSRQLISFRYTSLCKRLSCV